MTESRCVTLCSLNLLELLVVLHSNQVFLHLLCVVTKVDGNPRHVQIVLLFDLDAQELVVQLKGRVKLFVDG